MESLFQYSFTEEVEFMLLKWNQQEVEKFIGLVDQSIENLSSETWQGKFRHQRK